MKSVMKKLASDEKGAAFVVALVLLLIGGLISAALLSHMGAGLLAGEVYETRTAELYAADAGVEDAIWRIENDMFDFDDNGYYSYPEPLLVNGKSVQIEIYREDLDPTCGEEFRFQILSTAVTVDDNNTAAVISSTAVESYVSASFMDFSGILDNVITTLNQIGPPSEEKKNIHIIAEGHEPVEYYPEDQWPEASELIKYYKQQIEGVTPYGSDEIVLTNDVSRGPIYSEIESLFTIKSSSAGATLTVDDTIYITGETLVGKTGDYMKLNLNSNTIFVESDTAGDQKAFWLGGNCEVEGPGVIVAIGDIELAPSYSIGSEAGPVFIISVSGSTTLRPGADQGDFYGCIAGNVTVVVQSGSEVNMKYPDQEGWYEVLNFPLGDIQFQDIICSIDSWEIIQQ